MSRVLILLCAAGLLAGCSMFGPKPVKPDWESLTFAAADDANDNTALAVDVVLVKDKTVLDALMAMPAAKYFSTTASMQRTYPEGMHVVSLEIVPGQLLHVAPSQYKNEKAWGALAFANYATPGDHRERLMLDRAGYVLQFGAQGFSATAPAP